MPGSVGGDSRKCAIYKRRSRKPRTTTTTTICTSISVRGVSKCAMSARLPRCLFPTRFYSFHFLLFLSLSLSLPCFLSSFPPLATSTLHSSDVTAAGAASSAATPTAASSCSCSSCSCSSSSYSSSSFSFSRSSLKCST